MLFFRCEENDKWASDQMLKYCLLVQHILLFFFFTFQTSRKQANMERENAHPISRTRASKQNITPLSVTHIAAGLFDGAAKNRYIPYRQFSKFIFDKLSSSSSLNQASKRVRCVRVSQYQFFIFQHFRLSRY